MEVVCRELVTIEGGNWRQQQEQDTDLRPVLQWVEAQQKLPWEGVLTLSKGLWAKFGVLRLCLDVLQQAWKEPATDKERWQVVVPKGHTGGSAQGHA